MDFPGFGKWSQAVFNLAEDYDFPRIFLISSHVGMTSLPGRVSMSVEIRKLYWGTFLITPIKIGSTA